MLLKIKDYRITKRENIAYRTELGEIYLNPNKKECVENFKNYFLPWAHDRECLALDILDRISSGNGSFNPELLVGRWVNVYLKLEPSRIK